MKRRSRFAAGNSIIEYVLPASLVVIGAGVIASTFDINQLAGQFFASANGGATTTNGTQASSAWGNQANGIQGIGSISWGNKSGNNTSNNTGTGQPAPGSTPGTGNAGAIDPVALQGISNATSFADLANNQSIPAPLRTKLSQLSAGTDASPTDVSSSTVAMAAYAASHPNDMNTYGQAALEKAVNLSVASKMGSSASPTQIANMPYAQKVGVLMGMTPADAQAKSQNILAGLAMGMTNPSQMMQIGQPPAGTSAGSNPSCMSTTACEAFRDAQQTQAASELSAAQAAALAQANATAQAAYNQQVQATAAANAASSKVCPPGTVCTQATVPPFVPITAPASGV